jgi:hypothetical protein
MVSIAATLWLLISLAFILDSVKAPLHLIRATLGLLAVEFVIVVAPFADDPCVSGPCDDDDLWLTVVSYVTPGLAGALTLYAIGYGLLRHRGAAR